MLIPVSRIPGSIAQQLLAPRKPDGHRARAAALFFVRLRLLPLAAAFALLASPALAAWTAVSASGGVLLLQDGEWTDLPVGSEVASGVPVRTLQSGRVELSDGGLTLQLGSDSAVQVDEAEGGVLVTQFAGTVLLDARVRRGEAVVLRTPELTVTLGPGRSQLTVFGDTGRVVVASGSATITDNVTGAVQAVGAGADLTQSDVVAAASAPGNGANSNAGGNPDPGGNSNAGGNGNGNSGGNGNNGNNGNSGNSAGGNGGGGNGNGNGNGKPK
jgi:hypothetical protein